MVSYADRPWVHRYDKGVPTSLYPYPSIPIYDFLRQSAARHPDSIAIITSAHLPVVGRKAAFMTYRELDEATDALAVALSDLGVKKGDRVAIIMPNCAQFVIAFFGILKAGAVVAATNPTYPAAKMREQIKDSGANTVITMSLFYNTFKQAQPATDVRNVIVTNIKEYLPGLASFLFTVAKEKKGGHRIQKAPEDHNLSTLLRRYRGRKLGVHIEASDPAIFQYTGGTTGVPKAAVSTHQALVANTMQCKAFLGGANPNEIFMAAIPLFHVFGMIAVVCLATGVGAAMAMIPNPREINEVLEVIDKFKPKFYMGVPAMFNAINNNKDVAAGKYDLRSIEACISGSAPLPLPTKHKFEKLTGGKLVEGYGMSETPTAISVNPLNGEIREGSIGLPLPDVDIRIVDIDDGTREVPVGEVGELIVRGPQLMTHYHNMPEETDKVLRVGPDGQQWLYTGDIAKMDQEGYFYIVDRKKDMVLVGGYNVYPTAIEKILLEHPAIAECAVAGIPHPDKVGQEALKAWIVLKPDHTLTEKEIVDHAAERLAQYEIPHRYQFINELPRTTVGKVLRRELVAAETKAVSQDA